MKKEIIITILGILLIIIGECIAQSHTKKCVEDTNNMLYGLKQQAINRERSVDDLKLEADNLYDIWKDKSNKLAFYIEHDELEKVDTQIKIVSADFEAELVDEAIPELEQGIYLLDHIKDKYELKLKNIF